MEKKVDKTNQLRKLVEFGVKAPSGHNTQPWHFKIKSNEIQIHPDFSRSLPVVDSDNHALYISLGCAAENIVIAARENKLESQIELSKDDDGNEFIKISLETNESTKPDNLFKFIDSRQCTRNEYSKDTIPSEDIERLKDSFNFPEIDIHFFNTRKELEDLKPLIIEGSNLQFQNKSFVNELVNWIRFSKTKAKETGDGIWVSSLGIPNLGRLVGNILMKSFVSASSEAKRWDKLINTSAGLALFTAKENNTWNWVTLGRAFQRFGLTATELKISHAHVNMPCEEIEVRKRLVNQLDLQNNHPLLLLRYGYSEKMPYSFRRSINDVIME